MQNGFEDMGSTPIYSLIPVEVYAGLSTSSEGLSSHEAAERLKLKGPNLLTEAPSASGWQKFLSHTVHPLAGILWVAGVIAFVIREPLLGTVIWTLVLVNSVFSYWRERRTEQAMNALRRLLPAYARVMRDGCEQNVQASDLVSGDVLILADGDNIPADARIVEAYGLRTNNAILTGEAVPVMKKADASFRDGMSELERPNLVFAGTSVVSGTGRAVIFATGMQTQFGRIAHLTQAVRELPSPLQRELEHLTRSISIIAVIIGLIVFIEGAFDLGLGLYPSFLLALGILAAAVPEGLPATLTLTLAISGQRLAQRNVLVKKLSVIETLGTVSIICADKSGTLTQNQMTVSEIWAGGGLWRVTGGGYDPTGEIVPKNGSRSGEEALHFLLNAAMLCNNARLSPPSESKPRWSALGDQTEAALKVAAIKGGVIDSAITRTIPRIHELPFEARRKRMSTIHRLSNRSHLDGLQRWLSGEDEKQTLPQEIAIVKGAPREILALCSKIVINQEIIVLDAGLRLQILAQNDLYARKGLRVLGLAFRHMPPKSGEYTPANVECELTFLGLMAMLDPARPEVAEAIKSCKQGGIRIVMVTGDYGLTAESIARRVGLLSEGNTNIVTGVDLDQMDDGQLQTLLDQEIIFARMAPEHKLRLVAAFQARGEVVAVTGDGVNDAPALRKADVGVVMGVTGTDVAKEAADLILVNDNFAAIVEAIKEGRSIYDNLRKFICYVFASNVPEIIPFILTAMFRIPLALTVQQILAIDLLTDMLPGLALGTEKPEPDIMMRKPRRRDQPLIDRGLLIRALLWLGPIETILAYSGFFLVYALAIHHWAIPLGLQTYFQAFYLLDPVPLSLLAMTVYHAGVVMAQVGNVFASRSETNRGHRLGWFSNRFLLLSVGIEITLLILIIYIRPLADIFQHVSFPLVFWLWLGAYPLIIYGMEWLRKQWARQVKHKKEAAVKL